MNKAILTDVEKREARQAVFKDSEPMTYATGMEPMHMNNDEETDYPS